jgi:hypothetical protein
MKYTKAIVLLSAFGLSAPAFAGSGRQQTQVKRGGQIQQKAGEVQLTGVLESVRWTEPAGAMEPHVLATVRPEAGPVFVVDLGPASNLENLTIVLGEPVTVIGYSAALGEANFVADRIATSGRDRFLVINREPGVVGGYREQPRGRDVVIGEGRREQPRGRDIVIGEERREQPRDERGVTIRDETMPQEPTARLPEIETPAAGTSQLQGHIVELNWEQVSGYTEPHLLAQVRTQDGTLSMVDLGAMSDISELRLQEGTLISVRGSYDQFNGQSVLVADVVAEIAIIDHQEERQAPR